MSELFEVIEIHSATIACDGGKGPLGHPNVYLTVNAEGYVDCPYCSRRFQLTNIETAAGAH